MEPLKFEINVEALRASGIYVGTPMYGGMCHGAYTKSIMRLAVMCAGYGIPFECDFMYNESLVQRARNYITDNFMRSKMQQMIFIDADIEFNPEDVLILADLQNKNESYDIICAPYPKKMIAWEKIKAAVDKGFADKNPEDLEHFVGDFVFNAIAQGRISLREPAEVAETGTGFMMIRRSTFEKFAAAFPDSAYKPDHVRTENFDGSRNIHAYFDCVIDPVSKRYLSEDYYFCHKSREIGMKVWLAPWMQLGHYGTYKFAGSLAAIAAAGQNATADPNQLVKPSKKN